MNIGEIFAQIELDLLANMTKSLQTGDWRHQRMDAFKAFQQRNIEILTKDDVPAEVKKELEDAYARAGKQTERQIERRLPPQRHSGTSFSVNDEKLQRMVQSISKDLTSAKTAAFRMMDDVYRQTQIKAQLAMGTNLYTLDQAIDIASKDFLAKGLNSIRYANGNQVNIVSYAEMCLRTGNRRAGLQAEGAVRADWGVYTVWVSQYGACSDTCLPWQGRIYFDDVYSGGIPSQNTDNYPLLSQAIAGGLFHPNCRHKSSTWYPDLSATPERMDEEPIRRAAALEQQQRYNERQIRKWKRLEQGSVDPENKIKYKNKVQEWQARQRELIGEHPDVLRRDYSREKIRVSGNNASAPEIKPEPIHPKFDSEREALQYVQNLGLSKDDSEWVQQSLQQYTGNQYYLKTAQSNPSALRIGERDKYVKAAAHVENFIAKAPEFTGSTHRGVSGDSIEDIVSKLNSKESLLSWTSDKEAARYFAGDSKTRFGRSDFVPGKVRAVITSDEPVGVSIQGFSVNQGKQDLGEVLSSKDAQYEVLKINTLDDGTVEISVKRKAKK